jgi:phosphoribosylglycinamide formyltransferase-1
MERVHGRTLAHAPLPLAVLISGRGSNMAAIARAIKEAQIAARIVCVIADRATAPGIALARSLGLPTRVIPHLEHADRVEFDAALWDAIDASGAGLVVLAGFMRILTTGFVEAYPGRLLNVHPSLLPQYPGLDTHRRVLEAREPWHGASVHFVTPELDGGPVILQARIPVRANDTLTTLSARVQACEHRIYPRVIDWIARGRLAWNGGDPTFDGGRLDAPRVEDCVEL